MHVGKDSFGYGLRSESTCFCVLVHTQKFVAYKVNRAGFDPMQNTELLVSGDERTLLLFQWPGGSPLDTSQAGAFTTACCRYCSTHSSSLCRAVPKCILPLAYRLCFCWGGGGVFCIIV